MNQIFNFSAGPGMLPTEVLRHAQREFFNWNGIGISIMEVSHRSKEFMQVAEEAETDFRDLLNIPNNYKVLFCHGGARAQFSAIPLNLLGSNTKADYINSGHWAINAIREAKKYCEPNIINVKISINGLQAITPMQSWAISDDAAYVHFCPNETIEGVAIHETPDFRGKTVVADLSSTILSTPIDISKYGVLYAGAQKNIGPAGLTLVVISEDLLGKARNELPSILNYTVLSESNSMFNTPPTFAWYVSGLVFKWLKRQGGIQELSKLNKVKADLLYKTIDSSDLYHNNVVCNNRSRINIPFYLVDETLNIRFLEESVSAGLHALKGHKIAGGMRASLYNAMPLSGVRTLTDFMMDFEYRHHR